MCLPLSGFDSKVFETSTWLLVLSTNSLTEQGLRLKTQHKLRLNIFLISYMY